MKNSLFCLLLLSLSIFFMGCQEEGEESSTPEQPLNTNPEPTRNPSQQPNPTPTPIPTPTPTPNPVLVDPLFSQQWHIINTGQKAFSENGGVSGADINFTGYNQYLGDGVLIAVSDNAVQVDHEDLTANAIGNLHRNYNLSFPYIGDPSPEGDDSAHGTAVTGIIQARADNGVGGRGIAPKAQFAGFKFVGTPLTTARYIDQANGVFDIFNYSYGAYTCSFSGVPDSLISQLEYGVTTLRSGRGAIYVKASGNEYIAPLSDCYDNLQGNPYYLGNATLEEDHSYPYYVLVGALDADGKSAYYSTPGSALWITAPGGEFGTTSPAVVTTDIEGCDKGNSQTSANENDFESGGEGNSNCNYTSTMNGTSAAAPMVSGVVALMLSQNPNLTWRDVKYILATSAIQVDASLGNTNHPTNNNLSGHTYLQGWQTNGAGYKFHHWYGFGAINTDTAIAMARSYANSWAPLATIEQSSGDNLNLAIPDQNATGVSHTINFSNSLTIEAIQIEVDIEHTYVGDLGIELTSPAGTKSQLMLINSGLIQQNINNKVLLSNAFFMENSSGSWTLKIIDGAAVDTGDLKSWKLKVFGH